MDALVGNVGDRARYHRRVRKPTKFFWGMFLFGFLGIFIITQMHGLNFTTLKKWVFTLLYLAGASVVAIQRGALFYTGLPRIALIDYCGIFILAGISWLITKFTPVENPANAKDWHRFSTENAAI